MYVVYGSSPDETQETSISINCNILILTIRLNRSGQPVFDMRLTKRLQKREKNNALVAGLQKSMSNYRFLGC